MAPSKKPVKKMSSLKLLMVKLKQIEAAFNDVYRFSRGIQETTSLTQILLRLEKIDDLWERYGATLVEIQSHEDFDEEDVDDEGEGDSLNKNRQEFSDRYYEVKAVLTDQVRERQEPATLNQSVLGDPPAPAALERVRLPQIQLPAFNGEIDEWLSFRDLFTSLIHWKTDLPDVEKLHYLKGCLQGEPTTLIDSLQITAANYQVAWGMLTKRYNNSKLLKKRQIQSLLKLPVLAKESASELHLLVEGFEKIVQILDQIVQPGDYKDLLLVNLLSSRLDPCTRRSWEEFSSTKEKDTLKELTEFLQRRVRVLESLPFKAADCTKSIHQPASRQKVSAVKNSFSTVQVSGGRCPACTGTHPLFQCGTFQRMSVADKDSLLRSHSLCRNCFRQGHQAKECQSKYSCRNCKGRHHTQVCFKSERDSNPRPSSKQRGTNMAKGTPEPTPSTSGSTSPQVANLAATDSLVAGTIHQCSSKVLLATAIVVVQDDEGKRIPARALLDSGSESNFITEHLSQRLNVFRSKVDISVHGIGLAATKVNQRIVATIRSRLSEFSRQMGFLVLPKVTSNLPTANVNIAGWTIPKGVELADPSFCVSSGVDLVLGVEAFFDYFNSGRKIELGAKHPALHDSVFGWIVSGGFSEDIQGLQSSCNIATTDRLEHLLTRFWAMEEAESTNSYSPEESRCEAIFSKTVQRRSDGRYSVALPKNENAISRLGESKEIAFRRFLSTERRLIKDTSLRKQYIRFMEEYLQLGHMRKVEEDPKPTKRCFLPFSPVVKEASTTTKVRVVFDASCKTASGLALNEVLLVGPVIQQSLRSIILRSCMKQILLVADVEKMFRQILVHPEDRPFQSILWRPSPLEEVCVYELNTVTYGTKPASFLATRTLTQLAMDEGERYPLAAQAITEDTYMDDVITGCDNLEDAKKIQQQLDEMTKSGGFQLRKWASNCAEVLKSIPDDNRAIRLAEGINLDPDPSVKALGLTWLPGKDVFRFQFDVPPVESVETLTKRKILSIIATLFDPLGFIGATSIAAKVFMQLLWTTLDERGQRLDWDQPLPPTVGESWRKFHVQLPILNEIRIERCVIIPNVVDVQIHCFSDASQKAYGACLYIRSQAVDGNVKVQLLSSNSKVSPLKPQTIPRLELSGALIAAQLFEKVRQATNLQVRTTFWVDSSCALRWIQASPSTWSTFVANRVAKIQELTEGCVWRHVAGVENPADLVSRGIGPKDIVNNGFWWHGPSWLAKERSYWPNSNPDLKEEGEEERRRTAVVVTASAVADFNEVFISTTNSYTTLIRRVAIWQRLIRSLQTPEDRPNGFLRADELRQAECTLIRKVQEEVFPDELLAVRKKESVKAKTSAAVHGRAAVIESHGFASVF
ncbi:uncharacterized protein LOC134209722 [Armigeres subalbatus]|uniref:uncharacterized protein LOC134209722 n=1 Tax=Armigeres subalbatus TaxID=124917 RepID=UPI002ED270B0